jgi:DUF4097 and DUF4098 domain-containing protein YvlB
MKRLTLIVTYVLLSFAAVLAGFSVLALTSSTAYAHEQGERNVNETRPAKADGEVRVDNLAGTVRVQGWDRNEVRVSGRLGDDVDHLEITNDDSGVSIRVILPHNVDSEDCGECADLEINVPAGSHLEVSTVSADVEASALTGQPRINTVSGGITLNTTATRIEAKSTSGDVTVTGSAKGAHVIASSISGTVRVMRADGSLDAESVSGDVKVTDGHFSSVEISSTSGDLSYEGALQKGGNYEFHNVSGDLQLAVGTSPSARFDVSSFSGNIDNSFGPKPSRVSKYSPGMELHFTSGGGDAQVSARTLSGDIHLQN